MSRKISQQESAKVAGDFTNNRAQMTFNAQSTSMQTWNVMFFYRKLP